MSEHRNPTARARTVVQGKRWMMVTDEERSPAGKGKGAFSTEAVDVLVTMQHHVRPYPRAIGHLHARSLQPLSHSTVVVASDDRERPTVEHVEQEFQRCALAAATHQRGPSMEQVASHQQPSHLDAREHRP
jgi:hypothetical protein